MELFAHNAIEKGEPCSGLIVADNSRPMQRRHRRGHFFALSIAINEMEEFGQLAKFLRNDGYLKWGYKTGNVSQRPHLSQLQYLFEFAQLVQLSDNNASLASIFASEFNDLNIFVSVITSLSAQKIGRGRARPFSLLSPSRSYRPTPVYDLQTTAIIPLNACWQHITFIAVRCNFIKAKTCMPARIARSPSAARC